MSSQLPESDRWYGTVCNLPLWPTFYHLQPKLLATTPRNGQYCVGWGVKTVTTHSPLGRMLLVMAASCPIIFDPKKCRVFSCFGSLYGGYLCIFPRTLLFPSVFFIDLVLFQWPTPCSVGHDYLGLCLRAPKTLYDEHRTIVKWIRCVHFYSVLHCIIYNMY